MIRIVLPALLLILVTTAAVADELPPPKTVSGESAAPRPFFTEVPDFEVPYDSPDLDHEPMKVHVVDHAERERFEGLLELVEFDLNTRHETRKPAGSGPEPNLMRARGRAGLDTEFVIPDKDFTGLSLIDDPTFGIFPRHVRINMTFVNVTGDSIMAYCSGTLIGPSHVVTAGHCLYMHEDNDGIEVNDYPVEVWAMPGYQNNSLGPKGAAEGEALWVWNGWSEDQDYDHDVGLIQLDRPIGAIVGWRGYAWGFDFDYFETGTWVRYSYPGRDHAGNPVYDGENMYQNLGTFDFDDMPLVGFERDMYKGTSGAGAVRDGDVLAVRSHAEFSGFSQFSWDTQITGNKMVDIANVRDNALPATPDLIPRDIAGGTPSGETGTLIQDLSFMVHNNSSASFNGTVFYTVYLSYNSNIHPNDIVVTGGTAQVNLGPEGTATIAIDDGTTFVPAGLQPLTYTLGVILTNVDADQGNNDTQGYDTEPFVVTCNNLAPPTLAFPLDDHPCVPTDITLNWGSVPVIGVSYEIQVADGLWEYGQTFATSSTQILVSGLNEARAYQWRVRANASCGAVGAWSPPFDFFTEGEFGVIPKHEPAPDRACLDTTVDFTWDQIPNATYYRIWIQDIGNPSIYVDSPTNSAQVSGLEPGKKYLWSIKARDACSQWGDYGARSAFFIKHAAPVAPVPFTPTAGSVQGGDVQFSIVYDGHNDVSEYEVQRLPDGPVIAQTLWWEGFQYLDMTEGDWHWRVRSETCTTAGPQFGAWSDWITFTVDKTPPVFLSSPTSPTHTVGVWSNQVAATANWVAPQDDHGVAAYWWSWDEMSDSDPDNTNNGTGFSTQKELTAGDHWFHLRAVDAVGNVSDTVHLGPFRIDLIPPGPVEITGPAPHNGYVNADDLTVSWTAAADSAGVAGYSIAWAVVNNLVLDETIDTTDLTSTLLSAPDNNNNFYIRPVDVFGQAGPQQKYAVRVDRIPPYLEFFGPNPGAVVTSGDAVRIEFNASDYAYGYGMTYVHTYSPDNGLTWYEAELCDRQLEPLQCWVPGGGGGNWPLGSPNNSVWVVPWATPGNEVKYRIQVTDLAGNSSEIMNDGTWTITSTSSVDGLPAVREFALLGAVPNPFNPQTNIRFETPSQTDVTLVIHDLAGRRIRTLINGESYAPGRHEVNWNGTDQVGRNLASGIYLVRMVAGKFERSQRLTLLR